MNHKAKQLLMLFPTILLITYISGCGTIQTTLKELSEKISEFWEKLKGEKTEEQIGTREEAAKRYGYKGLKEELIVEPPTIHPDVVSPGDKIKQELRYALLAPEEGKKFNVSETIVLLSSKDTIELTKREAEKAQGTHLSTIQFVIPKDLSRGEYKLITTLSIGEQKRTVSGSFRVKR